MLVVMVRIPVGSPDEGRRLEERFRNRAGLVDDQPGFLGFELLAGDSEYISVTRWSSREDLDRWMSSQANAHAHGRTTRPTGGGHPHGGRDASGHEQTQATDEGAARQSGSSSGSVLIYEVVNTSSEGA